jgi:hypothetical protein
MANRAKQVIGIHVTIEKAIVPEDVAGSRVLHARQEYVRATRVFVGPDAQARAEAWGASWEEGCKPRYCSVDVEVGAEG